MRIIDVEVNALNSHSNVEKKIISNSNGTRKIDIKETSNASSNKFYGNAAFFTSLSEEARTLFKKYKEDMEKWQPNESQRALNNVKKLSVNANGENTDRENVYLAVLKPLIKNTKIT